MINKLKYRLARLIERRNVIELLHKGREQEYTYHGGFALGYLKGQIRELEDLVEDQENEWL